MQYELTERQMEFLKIASEMLLKTQKTGFSASTCD